MTLDRPWRHAGTAVAVAMACAALAWRDCTLLATSLNDNAPAYGLWSLVVINFHAALRFQVENRLTLTLWEGLSSVLPQAIHLDLETNGTFKEPAMPSEYASPPTLTPDSAKPGRALWIAAAMTALIGAFFLLREHWGHVAGYWPYLLLLACPVIHLFHRHGGHGHHAGRAAGTKPFGSRG